jgi:hypothetical protein
MRVAAGLTLVAALVLTGCTPKDELSVQVHDGALTVALCDPEQSNVIQFTADDEVIWRAVSQNEPAFLTGELLYGVLPDGYANEIGPLPLPLEGLDRLRVELLLEREGDLVGRYGGFFDGDALRSGDWVDEDGRRTAEAC